jgi:hypothetical protein
MENKVEKYINNISEYLSVNHPKDFVEAAASLARRSEGVYDLLTLWYEEECPEGRKEVIKAIQDAIDDDNLMYAIPCVAEYAECKCPACQEVYDAQIGTGGTTPGDILTDKIYNNFWDAWVEEHPKDLMDTMLEDPKVKKEHEKEMFVQAYANFLLCEMEEQGIKYDEIFSNRIESSLSALYKRNLKKLK